MAICLLCSVCAVLIFSLSAETALSKSVNLPFSQECPVQPRPTMVIIATAVPTSCRDALLVAFICKLLCYAQLLTTAYGSVTEFAHRDGKPDPRRRRGGFRAGFCRPPFQRFRRPWLVWPLLQPPPGSPCGNRRWAAAMELPGPRSSATGWPEPWRRP